MVDCTLFVEGARGRGEDRAVFVDDGSKQLIIVADGAGGTGSGALAAERLVSLALARFPTIDGAEACVALLRHVDEELHASGHGGETTGLVVVCTEAVLAGASVGDSRALLVQQDRTVELTENQTRKPLLGSAGARPTLFTSSFATGTLVVGTDGLFNYATTADIVDAVGGPLEGARRGLLGLVQLRSGGLPDDVAVCLLRRGPTGARARSSARRREMGGT